MKIKLICDVDIKISLNSLINYIEELGYIDMKYESDKVLVYKKVDDDGDIIRIKIPKNESLSNYDVEIGRILNLINIYHDININTMIEHITGKNLNDYIHNVESTEFI